MPFSLLTPRIQAVDGKWKTFRILDEFTYTDRKTGKTATVIVGFETDFASIPRVVRWRLDVMGKHAMAAVIHDWFYRGHDWDDETEVDRGEADRVLRDAADDLGVGWRDRWLLYSGVRIGGWAAWRRNVPSHAEEGRATDDSKAVSVGEVDGPSLSGDDASRGRDVAVTPEEDGGSNRG